nr:toMV resistant protein Tm-2 netted virescent-like [Lolium perenne]
MALTKLDYRLLDLYKEVTELVGIDGGRDGELIKLLDKDGDVSENKLKVVSVVGFGGLGKTTLVNAVYNKIKSDYDCSVFVPVGQNADVKKVLRDILFDLRCTNENLQLMDVRQLINEVGKLLENKRYANRDYACCLGTHNQ